MKKTLFFILFFIAYAPHVFSAFLPLLQDEQQWNKLCSMVKQPTFDLSETCHEKIPFLLHLCDTLSKNCLKKDCTHLFDALEYLLDKPHCPINCIWPDQQATVNPFFYTLSMLKQINDPKNYCSQNPCNQSCANPCEYIQTKKERLRTLFSKIVQHPHFAINTPKTNGCLPIAEILLSGLDDEFLEIIVQNKKININLQFYNSVSEEWLYPLDLAIRINNQQTIDVLQKAGARHITPHTARLSKNNQSKPQQPIFINSWNKERDGILKDLGLISCLYDIYQFHQKKIKREEERLAKKKQNKRTPSRAIRWTRTLKSWPKDLYTTPKNHTFLFCSLSSLIALRIFKDSIPIIQMW